VDDSKEKKLNRREKGSSKKTERVAKPPSSKHQQKRSTWHRLSVRHWANSIA